MANSQLSDPNSWRPPQWDKAASISITVPAGYSSSLVNNTPVPVDANGVGFISTRSTSAATYVFDAVLAIEHEQTLTKTNHPVQTGASISTHAYIEPARVVFYVLMSDVTPQYVASNQTSAPYVRQWDGDASKSVSAYKQMVALQAARVPLTVTTRLTTYTNMLIMKLEPREDEKTTTSVRFRVEFGQVFLATTQATPLSDRPNDTQTTGLGSVSASPTPAAVDTQFKVHAFAPNVGGTGATPLPPDLNNGTIPAIQNGVPGYITASGGFAPQYPNWVDATDVPGAGTYSSVGTVNLPQLAGLR